VDPFIAGRLEERDENPRGLYLQDRHEDRHGRENMAPWS
jgi:hypothetical protein